MTQSPLDGQTIAIIGGTGSFGYGLAKRLAQRGKLVLIGSRTVPKAREMAKELVVPIGGLAAHGMSNIDAAKHASIVILTVPWDSQRKSVEEIQPYIKNKLVVSVTVPIDPVKYDQVCLPHDGSAAMALQTQLGPEARVISAFHSISANDLNSDKNFDYDLLVFGDNESDATVGVNMVNEIGFRGIWGGALVNSVAAEALTPVLIRIAKNYGLSTIGIKILGEPQKPKIA